MLKIVTIASIGILPFFLNAGDANAQGKMGASGKGVRCPVNTCGKTGTERAMDAKYCSAANCPKNGPK
jgi:hypothetical protein